MAKWQEPSASSLGLSEAELTEWQSLGAHLRTGILSHLVPFALSVVAALLYSGPFSSLTCHFMRTPALMELWPPNLVYVGQFTWATFSVADKCWLFAVTSTTSAIWLCYFLCWRLPFEIFRKDASYVAGGMTGLIRMLGKLTALFFAVAALAALISWLGFGDRDTLVGGPSLRQPIEVAAFKIVCFEIALLFVAFSYFLEFGGLLVRYRFLQLSHDAA